jgi:hypothetical protein
MERLYICVFNDLWGFQASLSYSSKGRTINFNLNFKVASEVFFTLIVP